MKMAGIEVSYGEYIRMLAKYTTPSLTLQQILTKIAAIGRSPVEIFRLNYSSDSSQDVNVYAALDDIYHSESWQEMKLKAGANGIDLGPAEHAWLCNAIAYHYGFWPHTKPRFKAYCQLVAKDDETAKVVCMNNFMDMLRMQAAYLEATLKIDSLYDVPGLRDEIKAWKKLYNIVHKRFEKDQKRDISKDEKSIQKKA